MRKALALTLVLLVLSAGGLCLAQARVNARRDQVVFTERVLSGDRAAARGITVECRAHYDRRLFWDSTCTLGEEPVTRTQFTFSQAQQYETGMGTYTGVSAYTDYSGYGFDSGAAQVDGISAAYRALFEQTPAGEERTKTINLRDYYDDYPLSVTIGVPGGVLSWEGERTEGLGEHGPEQAKIDAFCDFFKIPVLEEEQCRISIEKNVDGSRAGRGWSSAESDRFEMNIKSVVADDACYFIFDSHTGEGKLIDTSQIPGGYGIYRLPYGPGAGGATEIFTEKLSMAYPLDPAVERYDLYLSTDKTRLLLLSLEDEAYVLTVVDAATMDPLQRLEIAGRAEGGMIWSVFLYDDFLALRLSDDRLVLLTAAGDGRYGHEFTARVAGEDTPVYSDAVLDWNGERLAVADILMEGEYRNDETCGFYLLVYDASGLLYSGTYDSSLDTGRGTGSYQYDCAPLDNQPLALRWGS